MKTRASWNYWKEDDIHTYFPQKTLFDKPNHDAIWLDIFEENASAFPHMVAVSKQDEKITYGELDADTNRLAQQSWFQMGLKNRDIVAACIMRHDISYLKWMIAIWKCGAVYLPLDPDIPEDRLQQIITDSGAVFVVGNKEPLELLNVSSFSGESISVLPHAVKPVASQPAYMIYTSGSTNKPKE
ncbi:MAG: AMP-binding protein [Clostridia bacterium]